MRSQRIYNYSLTVLILISVSVLPVGLSAMEKSSPIARLSSLLTAYGQCPWGYQLRESQCQPIEVPDHAFIDSSGAYWECERGYQRSNDQCLPVEVPANAFLTYSGHDWECVRGYQRAGNRCVKIQLPAHAFLDFSGHDWTCERGYQRSNNQCTPIQLPAHAHLDFTGNDWECVRGYERINDACELIWAPLGTPGSDTLDIALTPEDRDAIKQLQTQLKQVGYDPGPVDGVLGSKTLSALKQYMEAQESALANTSPSLPADSDGS